MVTILIQHVSTSFANLNLRQGPTPPFNSPKPHAISDKTDSSALDLDCYLDLHQIALTHWYQPPKYNRLFQQGLCIVPWVMKENV